MPSAKLVGWDFSKGLPEEIQDHSFDFIISTYAIHYLIDNQKINLIQSLTNMLKQNGEILIGDVSFSIRDELIECKVQLQDLLDDDEIYFVAEEIEKNLNNVLCEYNRISHCAGILSIKNMV